MDDLIRHIESERDLSRWIIHIDMDAFYAAVEMRDNCALRNVPMAVGGTSMLVSLISYDLFFHFKSTSNYAARKFGVRAAMPGFIARRLCPQLIIVPCNFGKYTHIARQVREILREYDDDFMSGGLDEAYLDITEYIIERVTRFGTDKC